MDDSTFEEKLLLKDNEIAELKNKLEGAKKTIEVLETLKNQLVIQLCSYKNSKCAEKNTCDGETQTFETDFLDNVQSGSAVDWQIPEGSEVTVADLVTDVTYAHNPDFIYNENTGLYYSISMGLYYNAEEALFIEGNTGTKYTYNTETQVLDLYVEPKGPPPNKSKRKKKDIFMGKLTTSFEQLSLGQDASNYSHSIRAIVVESENLKAGSLILIPCTGAVIGRETESGVCVPEVGISKTHAEIIYVEKERCFKIRDLGSQNGTVLNDRRLSEPKEKSKFFKIVHNDNLTLGSSCKLLLHVHRGHETCEECEPGLVQAELATLAKASETHKIVSKEDKEKERKKLMKQLKKKFGLEGMDYEVQHLANIDKLGYQDRSNERRATVGSTNPYEKGAAPASLEQAISKDNKGYKLLKGMGWSDGEGIGKAKQGNIELVPLMHKAGKEGLGSLESKLPQVEKDPKVLRWQKTQARYQELDKKD